MPYHHKETLTILQMLYIQIYTMNEEHFCISNFRSLIDICVYNLVLEPALIISGNSKAQVLPTSLFFSLLTEAIYQREVSPREVQNCKSSLFIVFLLMARKIWLNWKDSPILHKNCPILANECPILPQANLIRIFKDTNITLKKQSFQ